MRQRNEERIAERRDPRLIEQRTPGVRSGVRAAGTLAPSSSLTASDVSPARRNSARNAASL